MKQIQLKVIIAIFFALQINGMYSKTAIRLNGSQENDLSFYRSVKYDDFANRFGEVRWGVNSLTNLRLRTDIGDYVTFNLAVNINLLSGLFTDSYRALYLAQTGSQMLSVANPDSIYNTYFGIPFYYKSTYIGGFELERVSFAAGNQFFNFEMGLIRLSRGFGYAFSPNDYFNPKNPYNQKARPEGKLAAQMTLYPKDMWKIQLFTVAPDNPLESRGWGITTGASTMFSVSRFNFEFSYSLLLPEIEYDKDPKDFGLPETTRNDFSHIAGFSMKADIEIGFFIDAIYVFDHKVFKTGVMNGRTFNGYEGLQAAIGIDYTLPGGKVYLLTEYLFYGPAALTFGESLNELYSGSTSWDELSPVKRASLIDTERKIGTFLRHNYIFNMIRGKINDYLSISGSLMFGADDLSAVGMISADIEPVQAFTINVGFTSFIDKRLFGDLYEKGELGYSNTGMYNSVSVSTKIRF
ncbi:MAG: hypothetical protein A2015_07605 [Spirochaetes bacterium GWF1_31_7]|nr:MAG: hypothetical protein A2Y30_01700 [Spirochaetes bacterium GWE1_32_154]OHD46908.1 MAG: hypothetical protein A2015_07605 [Spirochaetes bacterium GWF1_31_7]OHD76196.1 MAG: hypothetical protein A2355_06555 [Spirochaetes bacterium RIFOXYB1_FULL_32_8]HBI36902.1 hypothetical protein [Spirochaetia bacterium]